MTCSIFIQIIKLHVKTGFLIFDGLLNTWLKLNIRYTCFVHGGKEQNLKKHCLVYNVMCLLWMGAGFNGL